MLTGQGQLVVEAEGLRKTFRSPFRPSRSCVALDGLDLAIRAGRVHGLLGANGSGKSTTIKVLLGLLFADAGQARIFGAAVPSELPSVIDRVGVTIEQPRFAAGITGRQNLLLFAKTRGFSQDAVERALSLTQLDDVADRQVKTYSMGMRQRLSISTAIVKAPDLLILDEPTNGLDPRGGHAIRRMLRNLADDGMTVLVSSHILAELEQFVDDVSIIAAGKCVLSGPLAELTAQPRHALVVRVKAHQVDPAKRVLAAHGVPVSSAGADGRLDVDSDDGETVNRVLCDEGIYAHAIYTRSSPLEDVFLRVTQAPGGARE